MSRIRTIKPEFWRHEDLSELPEATHMLAAALISYADDEGYFNANPKLIHAECCPLRELSLSVLESLQKLASIGYIRLGNSLDGRRYGHLVKFNEHQRVSHPTPSKIKSLDIVWEDFGKPPEDFGKPPETFRPERKGREGKGRETPNGVLSHAFEDFWSAFPKRAGTNSQSKAREKFLGLLKSGADPPTIIAGAERYAAWCAAEGKVGSEYVQQATTWLNQKGWENEYAATINGHGIGKHSLNDSIETAIAYRRWEEQQDGFRDGGEENVTLLPRLREGTG